MGLDIEAIYENGVLKLERSLPLDDGQRVHVTIHPPGGRVRRNYGLIGWQGDPEVLRQITLDPELGLEESP